MRLSVLSGTEVSAHISLNALDTEICAYLRLTQYIFLYLCYLCLSLFPKHTHIIYSPVVDHVDIKNDKNLLPNTAWGQFKNRLPAASAVLV